MSSTYSAASADSASDSSEPECGPSPSARASPIASKSFDRTGQMSLAMETSERSTELQETPTSFAEASHAKTSAMLVLALELRESDPAFGLNSRASLARFDPATSSWRTSQRSLTEEWEEYSETFPESGMTRSGQLYQRVPWALHMCDDGCSLWPTPTASMDGRAFGIPLHENTGRYKLSTVRRVHELVGEHGWRIHPHFTEALMGFPTGQSAIARSETPSFPTSSNESDAP